MLNEDGQGNPPNAEDAMIYAEVVELSLPVLADATNQIVDLTPWNGTIRPGKCVLSPDMIILHCYEGEDDTQGYEAIKAHAGIE